jgi:hypothetical protein
MYVVGLLCLFFCPIIKHFRFTYHNLQNTVYSLLSFPGFFV